MSDAVILDLVKLWVFFMVVVLGVVCLRWTARAVWRALPGVFSALGRVIRWTFGHLSEPPKPKRQALEKLRREYEETVELLEAAGLTGYEKTSALAAAKKLFLKKLDQEMLK